MEYVHVDALLSPFFYCANISSREFRVRWRAVRWLELPAPVLSAHEVRLLSPGRVYHSLNPDQPTQDFVFAYPLMIRRIEMVGRSMNGCETRACLSLLRQVGRPW